MRKKHIMIAFISTFLLLGCETREVKQTLECYVNEVIITKSDIQKPVTHQEALQNNFIYKLAIYDNGLLVVNDREKFQKIDKSSGHYMQFGAVVNDKINKEIYYSISNTSNNVTFHIVPEGITYKFDCK